MITQRESLQLIIQQIYFANRQKGFWELPKGLPLADGADATDLTPPDWYTKMKKSEKIALIHSELSEALEGIRKDAPSDKIPEFTSEEEEMADAFIRLMDYAGGFKLRLAEAIAAKLDYNATRPFKHGKAF